MSESKCQYCKTAVIQESEFYSSCHDICCKCCGAKEKGKCEEED